MMLCHTLQAAVRMTFCSQWLQWSKMTLAINCQSDESTDISTDKKLSIFAKFVNPDVGEAETVFVSEVDVDNGTSSHVLFS